MLTNTRMDNVNNNGKGKVAIYIVVILGTFLLVAFLVKQMVKATQPPPVGAERAVARAKDNDEIRGAGVQALNSWGYADPAKGVVRLPIDEAIKLTVQGYKNPGAFHTDLVARAEKASAPAPAAKNEFE